MPYLRLACISFQLWLESLLCIHLCGQITSVFFPGGGNAGGMAADPFAVSASHSQPSNKGIASTAGSMSKGTAPMSKPGNAAVKPGNAKKDPFADLFS